MASATLPALEPTRRRGGDEVAAAFANDPVAHAGVAPERHDFAIAHLSLDAFRVRMQAVAGRVPVVAMCVTARSVTVAMNRVAASTMPVDVPVAMAAGNDDAVVMPVFAAVYDDRADDRAGRRADDDRRQIVVAAVSLGAAPEGDRDRRQRGRYPGKAHGVSSRCVCPPYAY